jgi:hypothetical protein
MRTQELPPELATVKYIFLCFTLLHHTTRGGKQYFNVKISFRFCYTWLAGRLLFLGAYERERESNL